MNVLTQSVLNVALSYVGTRESGGNNRGPQVEAWLRRVHLAPGSPWCVAFQWCCLDDGCKQQRVTNTIQPCGGVVRMYETLQEYAIPEPVVGCWGFHRSSKDPHQGHIFMVTDVMPDGVKTVEGNTNRDGSRDGDSVWQHVRPMSYVNLGWVDYTEAVMRGQPVPMSMEVANP